VRVVKGGHRSRFTENKGALSQFAKNTTLAFHASWKMKENVLENHGLRRLWKSRFTRKKLAISHFTGKKRADHESQKHPLPPSIASIWLGNMLRYLSTDIVCSEK